MTARDVAFLTVRDVVGEAQRSAHAAFDYRCSRAQLSTRDRAFAAELAYGSLRARRLLDWYLKPYVGERLKSLPPSILEILRLGVYQLRMMDGVEVHAAVHETVNLALRHGHRGTAGLVNAVLRRFDRENPPEPQAADWSDPLEYAATRYSLPTWIVRHYATRFAEHDLDALLQGLQQRQQVALTYDTRRITAAELTAIVEQAGGQAYPSAYVGESLLVSDAAQIPMPSDQRFFGQSESAAMVVDILAPQPGEKVLEFCAGRGNKTLQLAMRQGAAPQLTTIELDPRKAAQLAERLRLADTTGVALVVADALVYSGDQVEAVLVDAPCSGLGIVGRQPEARWRKQPGDPARLAELQQKLLQAALAFVKPGGRLVYSVCSTDPREGEEVITAVQQRNPALVYDALPERYARLAHPSGGLLIPPGIEGRDGFFIARLTLTSP